MTVSCASPRAIWNVRERPTFASRSARQAVTSVPSNITLPPFGLSAPVTALNSVVLPAPFGPISPVMRPFSTARSAPSSAVTPPKRRRRPFTSSRAKSLPSISPEGLHEQVLGRDAIVAELAEIVRDLAGEQPVGQFARD